MTLKPIDIIKNPTLTVYQQFIELAKLAENQDTTIPLSDDYIEAVKEGAICDLNEGAAPFRPRYLIPDFELLMQKGCEFLGLPVPTDLQEATSYLLIFYRHITSGSTYPPYLGNIDTLLEPFIKDETSAYETIKLFLLMIAKTMPDSFVHANIGPYDTRAGRMILKATEELALEIPNLTLKYDPEKTSDEFANLCIRCMMKTAKPSFANDRMFRADLGDNYGIASCYNGFMIKGGAYTMNRIRLSDVAKKASDIDDFFDRVLPHYTKTMIDNINRRIHFEVEEAAFFKTNFMVKEGFLVRENFIGMFGLVGLAECCNILLGITDKTKGFGFNQEADKLGEKILQEIVKLTKENPLDYCEAYHGIAQLHAQVGIDSDGLDCSPGIRIPIGAEPPVAMQLNHSTHYQKYFPTGCGDVYKFDETWYNHPEALLDILKGAFEKGVRYFSGYEEGGDLVRVTGYLVKRSEIEKYRRGETILNSSTALGYGAAENGHALERKVNHEGD